MQDGAFRIAGVAAAIGLSLAGCASTPAAVPASAAAPTPTASATAASPDFTPGGSPLTLVWQTGSAPEDAMQDPIHLAMDRQGNIYVGSATRTGLIRVFDPDGHFLRAWGTKGSGQGEFSFLLGIGVDAQGNVYACDFERTLVNKFDKTGKFLTNWVTEPPVGPTGLAVDGQGNVYVANHRVHGHMVQKFDGNGKLLAGWGSTGTGDGQIGAGGSSGPEDLAVDQQGNVYVADRVNNRIEKYDTNGTFLATIGTPGTAGQGQLSGPSDVTVDGQGNIYVIDEGFLQKFDAGGSFLAEWSTAEGPLQRAGEVMADAAGNLYVNTDTILEMFSQ